jgi:hypothetical protein
VTPNSNGDPRSIQPVVRPSATRGAYCHASLAPADAQTACPRCDTRLHADCVVRRRCPTLGCDHRFHVPTRVDPVQELGASLSVVSWFFAAPLPLLCFFVNEARPSIARMLPHGLYTADVQRPLYPLLLWAVAACCASALGRRGPCIRIGLWGGLVLAALFSVAYAFVLKQALFGILFLGVGLLGFAPYAALLAYAAACWRYERAPAPPTKSVVGHLSLAWFAGWWLGLALAAGLAESGRRGHLPW